MCVRRLLTSSVLFVALVLGGAAGCGTEESDDGNGETSGNNDAAVGDDTSAGGSSDASSGEDASGGSGDDGGAVDASSCGDDHRKVGWTAQLEAMGSYDVSGTAKIVDNCTVAIEDFTYSGDGITVKIYGASSTKYGSDQLDFENGYPMSEDLKGRSFDGDRLVVKLPDDKDLDALLGVSVWCVDEAIDFGSGEFTK